MNWRGGPCRSLSQAGLLCVSPKSLSAHRMSSLDILRCRLCGPASLRQGVDEQQLQWCDSFSRYEVTKYAECLRRGCGAAKLTLDCLEGWSEAASNAQSMPTRSPTTAVSLRTALRSLTA